MIALLSEVGPRDIIAAVVIVVSLATIVWLWWIWPAAVSPLQEDPRDVSPSARGGDDRPATVGQRPYDWKTREPMIWQRPPR